MSVINQMLRDLEQRKLKEPVSKHYIDEVNIVAKSKRHLLWFILPVIIILIMGVYFYWHYYKPISLTENIEPIKNEEMILNIDFPMLPETLAEINEQEDERIDEVKIIDVADRQVLSKMAVEVKPVPESLDETFVKPPAKPKLPKQPSVKIKTFVKNESKQKPEAKDKQFETFKKQTVEKKSYEKKATVKSPVKPLPIKITSEEVVYQAGQLMATDQNAAIQLLKEKIKLVSPDADYYSLMANLQQRRNEYDDAIVSYRKAIEMAPDKGELWIGIALAYRATGEESNAKKAFKEALTSIEISTELKRYAERQL